MHGPAQFLWDPIPNPSGRFAVASRAVVKLYSWDFKAERVVELNSKGDLGPIKVLAWSPHSTIPVLASAGGPLGHISIVQFPPSETSSTASFSRPFSRTVTLVPPRQTRTTTSLAFSPVSSGHPQLLAQGLAKARSDSSVFVWDVTRLEGLDYGDAPASRPSTAHASFSLLDEPPAPASEGSEKITPVYHCIQSETINDLAWLDPATLAVSTQRSGIRLFDIRKAGTQPVLQLGAQAIASGLGAAGVASVASPGTAARRPVATGLAADPFSSYRLAAYDEGPLLSTLSPSNQDSLRGGTKASSDGDATASTAGGAVRIWDRRAPSAEIFKLDGPLGFSSSGGHTGGLRTGAIGVSWDPAKEGRIAVQERGGDISVWDTSRAEPSLGIGEGPSAESAYMLVVKGEPNRMSPENRKVDGKQVSGPWSTLAFATKSSDAPGGRLSSQIAAFSANDGGRLFWPETCQERPPILFTPAGGFSFGQSLLTIEPSSVSSVSSAMSRVSSGFSNHDTSDDEDTPSPRSAPLPLPPAPGGFPLGGENKKPVSSPVAFAATAKRLSSDIGETMKRRARAGYGLKDLALNAAIAERENDHALADFWRWWTPFTQLNSLSSASVEQCDFFLRGVEQVWLGFGPSGPAPLPLNSSISALGEDFPTQRAIRIGKSPMRANSRHRTESPGSARTPRGQSPSSSLSRAANFTDFSRACLILNEQRSQGVKPIRISVEGGTRKEQQRICCLGILGWDLSDVQLDAKIRSLKTDRRYEEAAFTSLFTGHIQPAIDVLKVSGDQELVSIAISLQLHLENYQRTGKHDPLSMDTEKLIRRVHSPQLRACWKFGLTGSWEEVLDEEGLPLRDVLGLGMKWSSDGAVGQKLQAYRRSALSSGELSGLLLTGLNPRLDPSTTPTSSLTSSSTSTLPSFSASLRIIQSYVDKTSDVQTAAILVSHVRQSLIPQGGTSGASKMCERWIDEYEKVLAGATMFTERALFRDSRTKVGRDIGEKTNLGPIQLMLKCHYCQANISPSSASATELGLASKGAYVRLCPNCKKESLPRCAICLISVGQAIDASRDAKLRDDDDRLNTLDSIPIVCPKCKHASHRRHLLEHFFGCVPAESPSHPTIPFPVNHPLYDPKQDGAARRSRRAIEDALLGGGAEPGDEFDDMEDDDVTCPVAGCSCICIE